MALTYCIGDAEDLPFGGRLFWHSPVMIRDAQAVVVVAVSPGTAGDGAATGPGSVSCELEYRVGEEDWRSCAVNQSTGGGTIDEAHCTSFFDAPPSEASALRVRMIIGDQQCESLVTV